MTVMEGFYLTTGSQIFAEIWMFGLKSYGPSHTLLIVSCNSILDVCTVLQSKDVNFSLLYFSWCYENV